MNWLPSVEARKKTMEFEIKKKVFDGLYKGFLATFGNDPTENSCDMAMRFAKEAAPDIASGITDAIDTYLKSLVINIPSAPQGGLVAPPTGGPVSGIVNIPDTMFMVS